MDNYKQTDLYKEVRSELGNQELVASLLGVSRSTIIRRESDERRFPLETILPLLYLTAKPHLIARLVLIDLVKLSDQSLNVRELLEQLTNIREFKTIVSPNLRRLEIRLIAEIVKEQQDQEQDLFWLRLEYVLRAERRHRMLAAKIILRRMVMQVIVERPKVERGEIFARLRDKTDYMKAVQPHLSDQTIRELVDKHIFRIKAFGDHVRSF